MTIILQMLKAFFSTQTRVFLPIKIEKKHNEIIFINVNVLKAHGAKPSI